MALLLATVRQKILNSKSLSRECLLVGRHVSGKKNLNSINFGTWSVLKQRSKFMSASNYKPVAKYLKYVGIGFGVGAAASGSYMYYFYKKISTPVAIANDMSGQDYVLQEPPPVFPIARRVQNPEDRTGLKITLYQFQTCPFCCKVRAYLDYYGFSYDVIEVNSVTHKQTKWSAYRKVPFIVVEQNDSETIYQLRDSSMIISALQSSLYNKTSIADIIKGYPGVAYTDEKGKIKMDIMNKYSMMYGEHPPGRTKEDIRSERRWRQWVDDVYVHMLSPNVYRTMAESYQAFNWFSEAGNWNENFSAWERKLVINVGAVAMYCIGKMLKKRHNLQDDVRQSFYNESNIWLKNVKNSGGKFMGGTEPNLADLGVYGVLMSIEGCDAFQELLQNTKINSWFTAMKEAVNSHAGAKYLVRCS